MSFFPKGQPPLESIAPRFVVQDMEQALAFSAQLGFAATYQDKAFALVTRDGIDLHVNASSEPLKGRSVCWIGVTTIDALYQQYLPTQAIQSPLEAQPWGMKEFFLCDPFRNPILFVDVSHWANQTADEQARRIHLMCAAYGWDDPRALVNDFEADLQHALRTHEHAGRTGAITVFEEEVNWMRQRAQELRLAFQ